MLLKELFAAYLRTLLCLEIKWITNSADLGPLNASFNEFIINGIFNKDP